MWHWEELLIYDPPLKGTEVPPYEAFKQLQHALSQDKELPIAFIIAAIRGAKQSGWPPQLLHETLDALYKELQGPLNDAKTGAIMETEGLEDCENLGEGACGSNELLEKLKLCISLFCHALRSQASWALQDADAKTGKRKSASSTLTPVQWLSIKDMGARHLLSILEALKSDRCLLSAYDVKAANKLIQLTAVELTLGTSGGAAQMFSACKALKQKFIGILSAPFLQAKQGNAVGAMEHLHLLMSVCLAKQHAFQAAQLLPAIMVHLYSAQDPPAACISIVAHLQRSAGALLQEVKASTKEAAQLAITKLSATLSILLSFCSAASAHAAWLTFALLLKDLPVYLASNQAGIRKLALDLAAAALQPGPEIPPKFLPPQAIRLIISGMDDKDALVRARAMQHLSDVLPHVLGNGHLPLPPLVQKLTARLLDKSASVRKKAICCVAALCDALAASENTFSPDFKAADLMAALLKPLGLIMCPPDGTTIITAEIERTEATRALLALAEVLAEEGQSASFLVSCASKAGVNVLPLLEIVQGAGLSIGPQEFRAFLDGGRLSLEQGVRIAKLLSTRGAQLVLQQAFTGVYTFCEHIEQDETTLESDAPCQELYNNVKAAWAMGGLSQDVEDATAEAAILLALVDTLSASLQTAHSPSRPAEESGVLLSEDQRVTAAGTYSRQAGAHAQCCVGMALKCLAEGVRRLSEGGGACSSLIAGWVLQRNAELGALSASQAWTELLKALFLAADGPSIGMRLFNQQAATLHTAMQDKSLHWAQLGSFFTLLGALPQCLKAEADAILLMIRRAREEKQEDENEAKQNGGAGVGADFDYMQKAETARLDEAAAISCMEKLLGEFEPCHFLPLLLQAVNGDHNSPDMLHQVAAIRAAVEYAVLSEGLAAELCSIVTSVFSTSLQPAFTHAPAAPAIVLGALNAGKQLLQSFPGMQDTILGPMGSLACSADVPSEIQEAAALAFGGCFLLPSIRATSMLGHVGAGACAQNPKVKEVMCHLLREAARSHPEPWSILMSTYASTPLPLRCKFAEVLLAEFLIEEDLCQEKLASAVLQAYMLATCPVSQEAASTLLARAQPSVRLLKTLEDHLQDNSAERGLGKHSCDSILSFLQNAKQTGRSAEAKSMKVLQQSISFLLRGHMEG